MPVIKAITSTNVINAFSGTPDGTKFLRDDGTLAAVSGYTKLVASGVNDGTLTLYDDTAVTGETRLVLRQGAVLTGQTFEIVRSDGTTRIFSVDDTGGGGVVRIPGGALDISGTTYLNAVGMRMYSSGTINWTPGTHVYDAFDIGLARSAAGHLKVTNGSTGLGRLRAEGFFVDATNNIGFIGNGSGNIFFYTGLSTVSRFSMTERQLVAASDAGFQFTNTAADPGATVDLGMSRSAAGILKVTNGSTGVGSFWAGGGTIYDDTATTGSTVLTLRAGAGQTNGVLEAYGDGVEVIGRSASNRFSAYMYGLSIGYPALGAGELRVGTSTGTTAIYTNSVALSSGVKVRWSAGDATGVATDLALQRVGVGILAVTDDSTGQGGIGISDSATNTVSDALILRHATSGTATTGFGTGLLFQGEDAAGNMQDMASIDAVYTDATNGSEDADLKFYGMDAGTKTLIATFTNNDSAGLPALIGATNDFVLRGADSLHLVAGGTLYLYSASSARWGVNGTTLYPYTTNTYDIGTSSLLVRKIYAATSGVQTANGAESNVKSISESITLDTGALFTDSAADLLPANSVIRSVVARITTTITTSTDWALGDPTSSARFASPNATLAAGTTTVGLNHRQGSVATDALGPVQTAAAKLRITLTGANPGAGVVRVTVFYEEFTAPTS